SQLDDYDIVSALKAWQHHDDFMLSNLSKMIINRDLLKIRLSDEKFPREELGNLLAGYSAITGLSAHDASYFVFKGKVKNQAYDNDAEPIRILKKDRSIEDVVAASDQ